MTTSKKRDRTNGPITSASVSHGGTVESRENLIQFGQAKAAMSDSSVLTSGAFAAVCRVAPRTVQKWVDAGKIPGAYSLPMSDDRRIPLSSAVDFMIEYRMTFLIPPGWRNAVLVSRQAVADADMLDLFRRVCGVHDYNLVVVEDGFEAMVALQGIEPFVVVIEPSAGREFVVKFRRAVRRLKLRTATAAFLPLDGFDSEDQFQQSYPVDKVLPHAFECATLLESWLSEVREAVLSKSWFDQ